jgi:hypothetical protein
MQPGVVVHTCNPSYWGGGCRSIMVRGQSRQKHEALPKKITKVKKGVGAGLK